MTRTPIVSAMVSALMLGLASAALAADGEFDDLCAAGLAGGQKVKTDCSINETIDGKTYCFGNEVAKKVFMLDPEGNLAKAQEFYATQH